jgi:hypothetical protein
VFLLGLSWAVWGAWGTAHALPPAPAAEERVPAAVALPHGTVALAAELPQALPICQEAPAVVPDAVDPQLVEAGDGVALPLVPLPGVQHRLRLQPLLQAGLAQTVAAQRFSSGAVTDRQITSRQTPQCFRPGPAMTSAAPGRKRPLCIPTPYATRHARHRASGGRLPSPTSASRYVPQTSC